MRERAYGDHKPPLPDPTLLSHCTRLRGICRYTPPTPPHPSPIFILYFDFSASSSLLFSQRNTSISNFVPIFLFSSVLLLLYSFPLIFILSPYISFIFRHGRHNKSTNCLIPAVDFPANREEENRDNSFE